MATNLSFDSASPFRIKRPQITTNGFTSDPDPTVKTVLAELDALLGKRVFNAAKPAADATAAKHGHFSIGQIPELLRKHLTPRHVLEKNLWDSKSIEAAF